MKHENHQLVTIKGTKEGLTFYLDDDCSFDELFNELATKLQDAQLHHEDNNEKATVILKLSDRYLKPEQKERLRSLIEFEHQFIIDRFDGDVIGRKEAENWLEKSEIKRLTQIVRSGQVIEITGDLLLVGDVNPGGQVRATGNIYILGKLHGIAHAGFTGNEHAVIAASFMNPTQLRIAKYISRAPDYEADGVYMECGYLDKKNNKIVIDRLQVLPYINNSIKAIERGIING